MSFPVFFLCLALLIWAMKPNQYELAALRELYRESPTNWPLAILGIMAFLAVFWAVWTMLPA